MDTRFAFHMRNNTPNYLVWHGFHRKAPPATAILFIIIFSILSPAYAIDFNIRGQWIFSMGYGENGAFEGKYRRTQHTGWGFGQDCFEAKEKINLQLNVAVSENLSGILLLEMGDIYLGQQSSGGALGADGKIVRPTNAYIDVVFPGHKFKSRMGLYNIKTPALASGNCVYNGTATGITLTASLTENLDITLFWARLFNDNYSGWGNGYNPFYHAHYRDNIDAFAFLVPLAWDGFSITPWLLYSASGPNAFRKPGANDFAFGNISELSGTNIYRTGMFPIGGARHRNFEDANSARRISNYSCGWWAGITGNFRLLEYVLVSYDALYGKVIWQNDGRLMRHGWFASLLLEGLLDWGKPGIYAWHSSGDDANPANGSERMPALDGDDSINYSHFAFNGSPFIERNSVVGSNLGGTMGIGFRIIDAEFIKNIKHIMRINLFTGTNSPTMAKKMSLAGIWANGKELYPTQPGIGATLGMPNVYLTSMDKALEVSSAVTFKLHESLLICLEGAYVALKLDTGTKVWGARHRHNEPIPQTKDAWNTNISFVYSF